VTPLGSVVGDEDGAIVVPETMDIPGELAKLEAAPLGAPDDIVLLGDAAMEELVRRTVNWLDTTLVEDIVAEALDDPCGELVEAPVDATDVEELDTIMDELIEEAVDVPDGDGAIDEPIEELDEDIVELDEPLDELDEVTTEVPIDAVLELTPLELEEPELDVVLEVAGALEMVMLLLIAAVELDNVVDGRTEELNEAVGDPLEELLLVDDD
ncbi:hypothetical protein LTR16_008838, partial [Cryomyces antarcticus]